jgi:hypothetical protein
MEIVRGTTPTIRYTFKTLDVTDITTAYLMIKQSGAKVIDRGLDTATVGTDYLEWKLTQTETLKLTEDILADICLDWLLDDGTRGIGKTVTVQVSSSAKNEVIS